MIYNDDEGNYRIIELKLERESQSSVMGSDIDCQFVYR